MDPADTPVDPTIDDPFVTGKGGVVVEGGSVAELCSMVLLEKTGRDDPVDGAVPPVAAVEELPTE